MYTHTFTDCGKLSGKIPERLFGDIYENGVVKNLSVYGTVTGVFYTGGIAGASIGTISNCNNYASISMDAFGAGGIVGGFVDGTNIIVENCVNYGSVTISSSFSLSFHCA